MINIRDPAGELLAILEDYTNDELTEEINGAYTLKFAAFIDGDGKADYIVDGNFAEVDGQLFNIVHHARTRGEDGILTVVADCEHISYALNNHIFTEGYIHAGQPISLMTVVLAGSGFTIGTVDVPNYVSIEAAEEGITGRSLLMEIAVQSGGDLVFDNRVVSLLQDRGADRGVEFRAGKNIMGLTKDVDARSGVRVVSYAVDVLELSQIPEYEDLESYKLGDTVRVLDDELGVDELQRVVRYSYSPRQRAISKLDISNVMAGLEDRVTQIKSSAVFKGRIYNGTSISPEDGFVAERSDKMARAVMSATEGIKLQSGTGAGSYTDVIYFDFAGDAVFTGIVTGSEFIGGSITIGAGGSNVFRANYQGIWAGSTDMVGAPFSVDMQGHMIAYDAEFSGTIIGSFIQGGIITGATIRTSPSGRRVEMSEDGLMAYDSFGLIRIRIGTGSNNSVAALVFTDAAGQSAGEINSYQSTGLTIYSDDRIFIGSNNTATPIELRGIVRVGNIENLYQYLIDKVGEP